jgi:hypothetical protein
VSCNAILLVNNQRQDKAYLDFILFYLSTESSWYHLESFSIDIAFLCDKIDYFRRRPILIQLKSLINK